MNGRIFEEKTLPQCAGEQLVSHHGLLETLSAVKTAESTKNFFCEELVGERFS